MRLRGDGRVIRDINIFGDGFLFVMNQNELPIIIYGAHLVAIELYRYLVYEGYGDRIKGFAVSDMENNPDNICGIKVKTIYEYDNLCEALVYIAAPEKFHKEIIDLLHSLGCYDIECFDLKKMSELKRTRISLEFECDCARISESKNDYSWFDMTANDDSLRIKYPILYYMPIESMLEKTTDETVESVFETVKEMKAYCEKSGPFSKEDDYAETLNIFMAYSRFDYEMVKNSNYPPIIRPLYLGERVADYNADLSDSTGENISSKNRDYAELTATYWIWKNSKKARYKGLCHYRRHFIIGQDLKKCIENGKIDAVLTTPRYAVGGVGKMFIAETPVKEQIMNNMKEALKLIQPECYSEFIDFLEDEIYCPNNMVIAKNDIYDSYCKWMFPILFEMEKMDLVNSYEVHNRHIAYAAELLTSFYFMKLRTDIAKDFVDYVFIEKENYNE